MGIDSLDIAVKMCDRVVRLVEKGKSVEEIQGYFDIHRAFYKSLVRSGAGRSQNDWDRDDEQFEAFLEGEPEEPGILSMLASKVADVAEELFDRPESESKPKREGDKAPTAVNRMLTSNDIRG